jgi:Flp pilus assembly protein TadD
MTRKRHYITFTLYCCLAAFSICACSLTDTIKARQLAREGNALYNTSDYHGAIEKYIEARQLDPDTPNLFLNLGYSYFSVYNPEAANKQDTQAAQEAINAFEEHLRRFPNDEKARSFKIKTLLKAAPYDVKIANQAKDLFTEMIHNNPRDHEARQSLINLFIDCKRYEDALDFFKTELQATPDNIETMKILAIIADKSNRIQDSIDWYLRRADVTRDPERKALLFYEVGTYIWNLLHYQPDRITGNDAIQLADQGIEATKLAMKFKEKYAEAMVYGNLLYLKRAQFEPDERGKSLDLEAAYELRREAGKIISERNKEDPLLDQYKNPTGTCNDTENDTEQSDNSEER